MTLRESRDALSAALRQEAESRQRAGDRAPRLAEWRRQVIGLVRKDDPLPLRNAAALLTRLGATPWETSRLLQRLVTSGALALDDIDDADAGNTPHLRIGRR